MAHTAQPLIPVAEIAGPRAYLTELGFPTMDLLPGDPLVRASFNALTVQRGEDPLLAPVDLSPESLSAMRRARVAEGMGSLPLHYLLRPKKHKAAMAELLEPDGGLLTRVITQIHPHRHDIDPVDKDRFESTIGRLGVKAFGSELYDTDYRGSFAGSDFKRGSWLQVDPTLRDGLAAVRAATRHRIENLTAVTSSAFVASALKTFSTFGLAVTVGLGGRSRQERVTVKQGHPFETVSGLAMGQDQVHFDAIEMTRLAQDHRVDIQPILEELPFVLAEDGEVILAGHYKLPEDGKFDPTGAGLHRTEYLLDFAARKIGSQVSTDGSIVSGRNVTRRAVFKPRV